ncbi:MAG TPA: MauE/DoxX family redox-associated membrane protein [Planctomycetota bacterium]|jgi:uncharacterized membrane protein YphA (DoxX/SURF4 family)
MKLVSSLIHYCSAPFVVAAKSEPLLGARLFSLLTLLARLALGASLLYAGLVKVPNSAAFAQAVANFDLLPPFGNQFVAVTLPWMEIVIGLLLICGLWVRGSALVSLLMFLGFSAAVLSALARDLNIECGCFGTDDGARVGLHTLAIESGGIIAGTLVLIFPKHSVALLRLPKKVVRALSNRTFRVSAREFKKKRT